VTDYTLLVEVVCSWFNKQWGHDLDKVV